MKGIGGIRRTGLTYVILLFGSQVWAAGGEGSQGVLFAGNGIDWERSGTEARAVPAVDIAKNETLQFPPVKGNHADINSAQIEVKNNCSLLAGSSWISHCKDVEVKIRPPTAPAAVAAASVAAAAAPASAASAAGPPPVAMLFCGQWIDQRAPQKVDLYALNIVHEGNGRFRQDKNKVTFACATDKPVGPTADKDWNYLGAIGKCLLWPKVPPPSVAPPTFGYYANPTLFEACLRAVRADYCGDGVTHTKDSTIIDLYPAPGTSHVPSPTFLLEANWNEKGAICILHARYASLPSACQRRFPCSFGLFRDNERPQLIHFIGTEYHCALPDKAQECPGNDMCKEQKAFTDLLKSGLLMDDSLLQP